MTVVTHTRPRQYFIAGAFWNGTDDQYDRFIRCNIWQSGWDSKTDDYMYIIKQMKIGDRIAIKKGLGGGSSDMMIRAIGIIQGVDPDYGTAFVEWKVVNMKRKVPSHGCLKTLHGPFVKGQGQGPGTDWINQVFSL